MRLETHKHNDLRNFNLKNEVVDVNVSVSAPAIIVPDALSFIRVCAFQFSANHNVPRAYPHALHCLCLWITDGFMVNRPFNFNFQLRDWPSPKMKITATQKRQSRPVAGIGLTQELRSLVSRRPCRHFAPNPCRCRDGREVKVVERATELTAVHARTP